MGPSQGQAAHRPINVRCHLTHRACPTQLVYKFPIHGVIWLEATDKDGAWQGGVSAELHVTLGATALPRSPNARSPAFFR